jgi:hypothetical protein
LHSVPAANRIAGYRIGRDQSAAYSIRLQPPRAAASAGGTEVKKGEIELE